MFVSWWKQNQITKSNYKSIKVYLQKDKGTLKFVLFRPLSVTLSAYSLNWPIDTCFKGINIPTKIESKTILHHLNMTLFSINNIDKFN